MKSLSKNLIIFLALVLGHLFLQYKIMEIGVTWGYREQPPSEIALLTLTGINWILNPLMPIAAYIDHEIFRIRDAWYYISAVAGSFLWAFILIMGSSFLLKKRKAKSSSRGH